MRHQLYTWRLVRIGLLAIALCGAVASTASAQIPNNPLYDELQSVGVKLSDGQMYKLPPPAMADRLAPADQEAALKKIVALKPGLTMEEFTKRNRNSPFILKMNLIGLQGGGATRTWIGQSVDVYFIVFGDLKVLNKKDLVAAFKQQPQAGAAPNAKAKALPSKSEELPQAELQQRKIDVMTAAKGVEERYQYSQGALLDKVYLEGVNRTVGVKHDDVANTAIFLDPRFVGDKKFPNQWRAITFPPPGAPVLGTPAPYEGFGAYGKFTPLAVPKEAILVEFHLVFNEPKGWFQGANLLGSKVPIIVKDRIEELRQKVDAAMKEPAADAPAVPAPAK